MAAKVEIPSVYVTMQDGEMLLDAGEVDLEVSLGVIRCFFFFHTAAVSCMVCSTLEISVVRLQSFHELIALSVPGKTVVSWTVLLVWQSDEHGTCKSQQYKAIGHVQ